MIKPFFITTLFVCFSSLISPAQADGPRVSFRDLDGKRTEIRIGDEVLGVLNYGDEWRKPFIFPLNAPSGVNVLRDIVPTAADQGSSKDGRDHFHHKGVWVSVDSVNDEKLNFWHEGEKIVCDKVEHSVADNGTGTLTLHNSWIEADKPLVRETTTITIHPSRLLVYQIALAAVDKDVTFYDTKEGFFAVRVAHTMREMNGGFIENADGLKGEKTCWGKESPWVDYYGEVDGKTCGVTLMDCPENFRKSRYHVRAYGLFAVSPFGPHKYSNGEQEEAPVTLVPGRKGIQLRYGLLIHDGDTEAGKVADAYQKFLSAK
ncbi:MAG: PmoA family protein [Planctomycetaceae bacterium]|nr:PmoA family protein [Planctomycetaceae bacterium]